MRHHTVTIRRGGDVLANPSWTRHLLGGSPRQIDGLRTGLVRLLGPSAQWTHGEQFSPIHAPPCGHITRPATGQPFARRYRPEEAECVRLGLVYQP